MTRVEHVATAIFASHRRVLTRAVLLDRVALLAIDPVGAARDAALAGGWDGKTSPTAWLIYEDSVRERFLAAAGFAVSAWLAVKSPNVVRVVALLGEEIHLLDHTPRRGFRLVEPASVPSA